MELHSLNELYTLDEFKTALTNKITNYGDLIMGLSNYTEVLNFIASSVYGYFYTDYVAYTHSSISVVKELFTDRLGYDVAIKFPYWYRKYNYIKKLLTDAEFSLLQTSKATSSSSDVTQSASGSLQKGATTPTGVSTGTSLDRIGITMSEGLNDIDTTGFVDKYTSYQQKYANANRVKGSRSGTITREGSVDDLINVLEKLPASFGDEITKQLQKHFIFDYDCLMKGYYED